VVRFDAVRDGVLHLEAPGNLRADDGVRALHFVVDCLPEVVQESAGPRHFDIRADLASDHRGDVPGLDAVAHHVLSIARAIP
jgi:hypothetical protein